MKLRIVKNKMIRILAVFFVVGILAAWFFASSILTNADRVVGPWNLTAPSTINAVCSGQNIASTLSSVANNDPVEGSFTGKGFLTSPPSSAWSMSGSIKGSSISFTITLEGSAEYNMDGTIAADGSISGTSDNNCQTFSMPVGSAKRFDGNHGQFEKFSDDKKEAAKSRVGMPVNSKGSRDRR